MTAQSPTVEPNARAKVVRALPCDKCGYNLESLDAQGACPECGVSVVESLNGPVSVESDTIQSFRNALIVICIGGGLLTFTPVNAVLLRDTGSIVANLLIGLWSLTFGCGLLAMARATKKQRPFTAPLTMADRPLRSVIVLASLTLALSGTVFLVWLRQLDDASGPLLVNVVTCSCATTVVAAALRVARLTRYIRAWQRTRGMSLCATVLAALLLGNGVFVAMAPRMPRSARPEIAIYLLFLSAVLLAIVLMVTVLMRAIWANAMLKLNQQLSDPLVECSSPSVQQDA